MSKVSTIAEVIEMEDDDVIKLVKGTLVTLYPPKTGTSDKGDYSFQNGELKSGSNKIKITFKDREEVSQKWKGKEIYILAVKSEKHGWTGCYKKTDTYKDEDRPMIWVTKTAEVMLAADYGKPDKEADNSSSGDDDDDNDGDLGPQKSNKSKPTREPVDGGVIHGATVGMCVKEACGVVNAIGTDPFKPDYYKQVKKIASGLINVSRELEAGDLNEITEESDD